MGLCSKLWHVEPYILLYYKNKNWLQFLFIVKAAVLKQQISKFYPQIQRTEASDHIYFSQRPFNRGQLYIPDVGYCSNIRRAWATPSFENLKTWFTCVCCVCNLPIGCDFISFSV